MRIDRWEVMYNYLFDLDFQEAFMCVEVKLQLVYSSIHESQTHIIALFFSFLLYDY